MSASPTSRGGASTGLAAGGLTGAPTGLGAPALVRRERPRTVLHLIDTTGPGGAETVFVDIVSRLDRERFRSVAVSPLPRGDAGRGWLADALAPHGVTPATLTTERTLDWRYLAGLVRLVRQSRADVIQAHLLTSSVYGSVAGRLCRVPVVSTFHGLSDVRGADRWRVAKLRTIGLCTQRVVFVSEYLRRALLADAPIPARHTTVIHNGVDAVAMGEAADAAPRAALRASLGVPEGALLVGAVGNVRPAKAYGVLLRAAAALRRDGLPVHVVVIGDTADAEMARLLALRAELGLEETVQFVGFRTDVPQLLGALDAYALTSSSEGFSIAAVQAMAARLPVVATRSGGPEEILDDGETGMLVPCDAPEAVATALGALLRDPARRTAMGTAARAAATRRFSVQATVRAYEALYETLAPARGGVA